MLVTVARVKGSSFGAYRKRTGWGCNNVINIAKADKFLFSAGIKLLHNKGKEEPVIDKYTAFILMTAHDYKTDFNNLQKALKTNASYIGLLGPRKRSQKMFDDLATETHPVS